MKRDGFKAVSEREGKEGGQNGESQREKDEETCAR